MKSKKAFLIIPAAALAMAGFYFMHSTVAYAEETNGEKVENHMDEAKKDVKHHARKAKRKVRNATGNHSTTEDVKDATKDAGDSVSTEATKLKRKAD